MWTLTCVFRAFHRAAVRAEGTMLGELYRATPLGILTAALKGAAPPPAGR